MGICLSREIGKTQKLINSVRIKLFILFSAFTSAKLTIVGGFQKVYQLYYIYNEEHVKSQSLAAKSRPSIE